MKIGNMSQAQLFGRIQVYFKHVNVKHTCVGSGRFGSFFEPFSAHGFKSDIPNRFAVYESEIKNK